MVKNYSVVDSLQKLGKKLTKRRKPLPIELNALEERRKNFREKFLQCLGDFPEKKCSLDVKLKGEFKLDNYPVVCESILYNSEEDVVVPAHIYKPVELKEKAPGILLIGGWIQSKWDFPHFKAELASKGFVVLVPDCRFTGERKTYDSEREQWNLVPVASVLGKTFLGMNTWDNIRAIDYLQSREDVNSDRVGVIGLCWGGMQAWTLAAIDERVEVAIPICGTSTYEALIEEHITFEHHTCLGTYIPNLMRYGDIQDIIALIAPRPLLIMNNANDQWFPVSGYQKVCKEIEGVYMTYGVPERFRHLLYSTTHDITPEFGGEAIEWFEKFLGMK